jgi:imidazolonepropionase-like amidohydrolase
MHGRAAASRPGSVPCLRAVLAVLLLVPAAAAAQLPVRATYAFTNVNVVPMDSDRVLADQTVVVQAGRITAVGPAASVRVPAGAVRIEGRGRYLLPGLAEMHGHIPGGASAALAEDVLFLYVAAGATTVRGMQGHPSQLELKRRVEAGELLGPRMWLAAPPLSGGANSAATPENAERLVRAAKDAGFDLLKVHEGIPAESYAAIVRTAREVGLPWGGHVSEYVGVAGALAARQSTIDHIDDYLDAMQPPGSPALAASGAERVRLLPLHADESRIPELARRTREAGVAIVPTQILWEVLRGARAPETMIDRAENRYMPRMMVDGWAMQVGQIHGNASRESAAREVVLRNRLLKAMSDEGVLILMGTDAPQLFSVPGFSLYRELPVMVDAGMSPYEVLRSGTVNVALFFGIEDEAGTVAVGRRADLLLLEANPLDDIRAVERKAGVMVDGRWLSRAYLDERLAAIAAKHAG